MASAEEPDDIRALLARQHGFEALKDMAEAVLQPADSGEQARKLLMGLADRMRALEHSSAADLLTLYASTQTWFIAERDYKVRCPFGVKLAA